MVWRVDDPQNFESDKIAAFVIPYTRGKGIDVGCGFKKVWPHLLGVDSGHHFGRAGSDIEAQADNLSLFADGSLDSVFSSHLLEHVREDTVPDVLREWARVLKVGGHLTLYVPSANLYPVVGHQYANPDHKWNIYPGDVERHLQAATDCGWTQIEREERDQDNEYSLFLVFQKRNDGKFVERIWERNPGGKKRCLVVRYGAIGDQIVTSSILPRLKDQGLHVTYNTTPQAAEVVKHDPHIDEFLLQDKDQVPNDQLGPYWLTLKQRYDEIINLSESVEGMLLALPGRLNHSWSAEARKRLMGTRNYLEVTHDLAGVPHEFAPKFYATDKELWWARREKEKLKGPVVLWGIVGSSIHKVYPWANVVARWLIERGIQVVLTGDGGYGKQLQDGIFEALKAQGLDTSNLHGVSGAWSIRQALAFALVADCVVGPETGVLNAVSHEAVPKVIYLSHSSHENLTKHWVNTTVLEPPASRAPCFPCHRLHYSWDFCHQDEDTGAALCAAGIQPKAIFEAVMRAIGREVPAPRAGFPANENQKVMVPLKGSYAVFRQPVGAL